MAEWMKYWPILLIVLNLLAIWISWSVRRGLVSREDYEAGAKDRDGQITEIRGGMAGLMTRADLERHEIDEHARYAKTEAKISHIERTLAGAPTRDDIIRLHTRLDQIHGGQQSTAGEVAAMRRQMQSMNDYLIGREK